MSDSAALHRIVFEIVEKIDNAQTVSEAAQSLMSALQPWGALWLGMTDTQGAPRKAGDSHGPLVAVVAPDGMFDSTAGQFILDNNPMPETARLRQRPFTWKTAPLRTKALYGAFWEAMGEMGAKEGVLVPMINRGAAAGVSVALSVDELEPRDRRALEFACYAFIDKVRALSPVEQDMPSLTPRERDCLAFVAEGKTNWEISVILGISENTVRQHVESCRLKLNATTRAQAVARFIMAGLM